MNKTLLVIVCAAAFLQACSKSEQPEAPPPNLTDASSVPAAKQAIEQKQVAQAPKADKATPLDAYKELTSGKTLMFTYLHQPCCGLHLVGRLKVTGPWFNQSTHLSHHRLQSSSCFEGQNGNTLPPERQIFAHLYKWITS